MIAEVRVKFYNSNLGIGYNDFRQVFSQKNNTWYTVIVHAGRLVYGRDRQPFSKLRSSVTHKNYVVREFIPF